MKSQCTKAHCKTAAGIDGRPAMIVCARDVKKKRQKKTVKGLDTPAKNPNTKKYMKILIVIALCYLLMSFLMMR